MPYFVVQYVFCIIRIFLYVHVAATLHCSYTRPDRHTIEPRKYSACNLPLNSSQLAPRQGFPRHSFLNALFLHPRLLLR